MSFTDDFLKELKKRNITITEQGPVVGGDSYTKSYLAGLNDIEEEKKRQKAVSSTSNDDDIGPVVKTIGESKPDLFGLDFFQKGVFEDGYQIGDITKTILGTTTDALMNVGKGALGMVEGITDFAQHGVAYGADLLGNDALADKIHAGATKNIVDDLTKGASAWVDQYSVLGNTSDAVAQGVGQMGTLMGAVGAVSKAANLGKTATSILSTGTMFTSGTGSATSEAYKGGATDEEALIYGAVAGAADAISELLSGGMGTGLNAVGFNSGLLDFDDLVAKKLSSKISNQLAKNLVEFGVKASGEGLEEVLAGTVQAIAKSKTYMSEKDLSDILADENLLEQFVVGAMTSGVMQSGLIKGTENGSLKEAIKENKDFITGQTVNEQAVIKKEIENRIAEQEKGGKKLTAREKSAIEAQVEADLEKGYISTDTIEEVLGGEDFKAYKDTIDSEEALKQQEKSLTDEYNLLNKKKFGEMTGEESDKRDSLKAQIAELQAKIKDTETNSKRNLLKAELSKKVYELSKNDRLVESYLEQVRGQQKFTADLSKYEGKAKEVVQDAIDSGILNNSNRTHDFVDLIAKISAEKGVLFDFTNNAKLKESGFAVGGAINGYANAKKGSITVNIQSKKSLNTVVGHEIVHVLRGTPLYDALQKAAIDYAKAKGEYQVRYDTMTKLYEGVDTDIYEELTAEITGDYVFTDRDFLSRLSTENRNLFQKIYDEVKYMLKLATAGSKEARELEKLKHTFEQFYREGSTEQSDTGAKNAAADADVTVDENGNAEVKFSLVTDQDTIDFLENQEHITTYKAMVQIDGKLYPPMASQTYVEEEYTTKKGEKKTRKVRKLKNPSVLGQWQQSEERVDIAEQTYDPKKGYSSFDLLKSNGKTTGGVAYNPYEHTSNIVLNDQFAEAYQRPELVTVEYQIPVSELNSGYKAQYAKDAVGLTDWKAGGVAQKLKNSHRDVYLTRWSKPVRVLSDAEVAQKYKEILDKEEGISVPWNVVTPSLRAELEKVGVPIDYSDVKAGSTIRTFDAFMRGEYDNKGKKQAVKYSLSDAKTPTREELTAKKPMRIVDVKKGIESASYADMKATAKKMAEDQGWFDRPHHNEDTDSFIFITNDSFTHAFSNLTGSFGEDTIRSMAHIPEIIKEAVLVDVRGPKDASKSEKMVYTFFAAIDGVNGVEPVKLTVKEFDFSNLDSLKKNIRSYFEKNGIMENYNTLYDAKALEVIGIESIKKETDASGKVSGIDPMAQTTSVSTISVADLLNLVKGDAEKYIPKFSLSDLSEADQAEAKQVISNLKTRAMSSKYGFTSYGAYTAERMDREIRTSSSDTKLDYAKSYITWVEPDDFIYATTGNARYREQLKEEAGELDLERLKNETQPIHLTVDFEDGRIVGHEGRHRMLALKAAGVEKVAVIIDAWNDNRSNTKPVDMMRAKGQKFSEYEYGHDFYLHDMLPLSKRYADTAKALFTNKPKSGVQFSLSDTEGRQLSKEQQEYFKDSKVRDADGNLKVMYHGTPNGDFTVFKDGAYFTDNKAYADRYQSASASSISSGKTAAAPKTFEVYLDIKKPFDLNDEEARNIYINEYIKGGNAIGINPYLSDAEYDKIQTIDWTEGEDLRDFLIDNGYDYDGLVLDEGADGGYGDAVEYRGTSYVTFSPEQVKAVDNAKPTADPDIRFSLSEAVEESKDLMALHNLQSAELLKSLGLGGLPMPSIAVIKAEAGHDKYGDVSLILPKNVIDPKANKNNKVYGGDAWTPTYPSIEYKPSKAVEKKISDKYYALAKKIGYDAVRPMYSYVSELERKLNYAGGEAAMLEELYQDTKMMNVYLEDSGKGKVEPVIKETRTEATEAEKEMNQWFIDKLGEDVVNQIFTPPGVNGIEHRKAFWEQYGEQAEQAYRDLLVEKYEFHPEDVAGVLDNTEKKQLMGYLRDAAKYLKNGGVTVKTETDYAATDAAIKDAAADGYKEWVDSIFKGVVEKSGIRNNADHFTPSGNRRSWDALHWENTLENVVKAMKAQDETGVGSFSPYNTLASLAQKRYGSIEEIKADSSRLSQIPEEEYEAMGDAFAQRFVGIASSIKDPNERNPFIAADEAAELIVDAVRTQKTKAGMLRYLQKWNSRVTEQTVEDIAALVSDIANMPTGYFEAKPQRAVSFDEVGVFVIPRNADVKLKQELLNKGYSIAEYDPNVEGDRSRVVNSFEEYKFSLSNVGDQQPVYGSYNVYGKDIALQGAQDIAPVQETVADNATVAPVQDILPDDYAPMSEEETAARQSEILDSLTDADAPAEVETEYLEIADTQPLTKKVVKDIVRSARGMMGLSNNQVAELYSIVLDYNGREFPSREALFQEIAERFGQYTEKDIDEELKQVKAELRASRVSVDDAIKNDITDYGKMQRSNFGKIRFSKEGPPVDVVYMEFAEKYPGYFPEDIINPSDQLQRMIEVANYEHTTEQSYELDDDTLLAVTDSIINAVNEFRSSKRAAIAQRTARESFNSLMRDADSYVPTMDGDIGPVAKPASDGVRTESTKEKKVGPRQALHQRIMDKIKTVFAENGLDLDSVLKNAKNLTTFATVDNTPQRVMEKALGYKEGQVLSDITVNQVARNETEGIKWLNKYTDRKNGILKQISDRYNIKPGSKESAAAQMYAEGFYVAENGDIIEYGDRELAKDFPDAQVRANIKGLAKDPQIRQIYDETLALINDSRTRNAYPEIQKLPNYFLHFRAMSDTFSRLGLPFNPNDIRAKDLPTDLNGVTADLKPGQPYFASANHRTGQRTSFDLLGGLEMYLTSAKGQIYHIDDIQTLRALRNYIADTFGQANGLEGLDNLTEEEVQERIEQVYGSHLSTFAKFLNEEANMIAGKTALIDRGLEGIIGRKGITFLETVNRQVGANMVGYNVSSSLTNFLAPVQAFAKTNKADFMKAFSQTVYNKLASINGKGDGFAEQSPVMIRRKGADRFHRTFWQKMSDPGYALMGAVDNISTEIIARTKFNEFTRKGMDAEQAHIEADKWTSRLMGDRSLGQQPHLYNSKMLGIVTKFQLEVRNQLDSQFYDTIQEAKVSNEEIQDAQVRNAKTAAKVASTFFQLAVSQHVFGKVFESIAGYNPAFDIIEALAKAFGWDDDEEDEDTVLDNIGQGFMSLMEDMPYSSVLTGGRIPIQSALPISEFFKGKDQYGNEKSRLETLSEAAPYYLLPGGYGQIKKTVAGLDMFSEDHPIAGSYTDSGNLRFPVEDTLLNRAQAAIFGQYASSNARDYFDNERQSLKKNQIQEFVDLDIPIQDYWEYRDGLKKQETLEDKFDYIAGLDLPTSKKNILINNVVDRKDPVDLTDYDSYATYDEFDFATKYPEKYAFFEANGISYSDYANGDDDTKDAYNWAYNNPDKYLVSKAAASDVVQYRKYTKALNNISADKDAYGKTISGSRKNKVIAYVNSLDIDYGERLILFKSEYPSDDTYNNEIVEYLNGREDISFDEEVAILKELGFIVLPDGTVQW